MSLSNKNGHQTGYGSPPQSGQFKKGQSGNPKGRPKKAKVQQPVDLADLPTDRIFKEQLYSLVKARTADGVQEMPFPEAMVKVMQSEALKGRRLIMKDLLIYMREQERSAAHKAQEISDMLEKIKKARQAILDDAEARNEPPPEVYPHPSDIVIDRETYRYALIGPFDETETPPYDHWLSTQRLFLIWAEVARRPGGDKNEQAALQLAALAQIIHKQMPPSYRWSDFDWIHATMDYESMSNKALTKEYNAEASRNVRSATQMNNDLALPQRNIDILNCIGEALGKTMSKIVDFQSALDRRNAGLDLPHPAR